MSKEFKEFKDLCSDMAIVAQNMIPDLELVSVYDAFPNRWGSAAKRVRTRTKKLAKMGLEFRKMSIIIEKAEKAARKAASTANN